MSVCVFVSHLKMSCVHISTVHPYKLCTVPVSGKEIWNFSYQAELHVVQ